MKVIYKCGHVLKIDGEGPEQTVDVPCPSCREKLKKKKEQEQINREELRKIMPELKGTEKQLIWAEKNRSKFIKHWGDSDQGATVKQIPIVKNIIMSEKKANWWIDNGSEICKDEFIEQYTSTKPSKKTKSSSDYRNLVDRLNNLQDNTSEDSEDYNNPHGIQKGLDKYILIPKELKSDNIIIIKAYGETINILCNSVPDDNVLSVLNMLKYQRKDEKNYYRQLSIYTGSYLDRATQTAVTLLKNGYIVIIKNSQCIEKIKTNSFDLENSRWVKEYDKGSILITWEEDNDGVLRFRALKTISGARWDDVQHGVIAPYSSAKQILMYVNDNKFSITDKALYKCQYVINHDKDY